MPETLISAPSAAARVERGDDALAAAGGVGLPALAHRLGPRARAVPGSPGVAGHARASRAGAGGMARADGMPRDTARCLRITVTASSIWARSASVSCGDVAFDPADEPPDPGDLLLGGGGVGAGPLVDAVDGGGEPFPGAQQVIEVGGQVGEVGDVGAEVVAAGAAEPDRAGASAGLHVGWLGAACRRGRRPRRPRNGRARIPAGRAASRQTRLPCRSKLIAVTLSTASRRRSSPTR